jgi:hypothetical protein
VALDSKLLHMAILVSTPSASILCANPIFGPPEPEVAPNPPISREHLESESAAPREVQGEPYIGPGGKGPAGWPGVTRPPGYYFPDGRYVPWWKWFEQ